MNLGASGIAASLDDLGGVSTLVLTSSPQDPALFFSNVGGTSAVAQMPNLSIVCTTASTGESSEPSDGTPAACKTAVPASWQGGMETPLLLSPASATRQIVDEMVEMLPTPTTRTQAPIALGTLEEAAAEAATIDAALETPAAVDLQEVADGGPSYPASFGKEAFIVRILDFAEGAQPMAPPSPPPLSLSPSAASDPPLSSPSPQLPPAASFPDPRPPLSSLRPVYSYMTPSQGWAGGIQSLGRAVPGADVISKSQTGTIEAVLTSDLLPEASSDHFVSSSSIPGCPPANVALAKGFGSPHASGEPNPLPCKSLEVPCVSIAAGMRSGGIMRRRVTFDALSPEGAGVVPLSPPSSLSRGGSGGRDSRVGSKRDQMALACGGFGPQPQEARSPNHPIRNAWDAFVTSFTATTASAVSAMSPAVEGAKRR